ncbi:MAG: phenylacetate-CoA oxygenase/reductase subunit PaaK [Burkholderiales bacterium]|nr:phenylacetate-CoA oxygenase/reductase subunit PaaK [Burkholderiales bacterium]
MGRFHPLSIARIDRETRDAVSITFAVPETLREQFRFTQGQHLTLRASVGGADLRRSYSICSAVQDDALRIAIKKDPMGAFSTWANATLRVGDVIDVMPPLGHFNVALDAKLARHYLGFAAGSGITPLLSIVKTSLAAEPSCRFTLVYGNRSSATVMFREELAALKDMYLERFNLVHVLSREAQDIELMHGRIDRAKADALLAQWVPLTQIDTAFVCGPQPMMDAVVAALAARGVAEAKVKVERFAASIPKHMHVAAAPREPGHAECEVSVTIDGATRSFVVATSKENIVEAGLRNGIELPYSCRGGVCATCRCRLTAGEVDMDVNFALEDYELARGYILACQSYPVTDRVAVTFDD